MSTTVLEALQNAQINFATVGKRRLKSDPVTNIAFNIATDQLDNAIAALENGKSATDVIQQNMFGVVNTGD